MDSFPAPTEPSLKELVETTLELHRVSHSMERPRLDEDWLESQRSYHSLDLPLPAILLYFRPGDAVMACFDDECEYWGQETPEPNLIVPLRPNDPASVRQALAVIETLMRVLVLTVRIKTLIEGREKSIMRFSIDVGSELELKLYQAVLLYRNDHGNRFMATVHGVVQKETDGTPLLGSGQLLSTAALRELTKQLGTSCPAEFLPENVVARTPELIAWWTPAAVRPMFFRDGSELAGISGKLFPHPALLFVVRNGVLFVRALPTNRRPRSGHQTGGSALLEHRQQRRGLRRHHANP